jgi:hypothetical protein
LTVNYAVSGSATNGTDYTDIGTSVIIPAGSLTATKSVTVTDDKTVEPTETAIVTIVSNPAYIIASPSSATVNIADNDVMPPSGSLPGPWVSADIGAVGATGTATYANSTFTIEGSGADVNGTADEFRYVHQASSGNCTIVARVTSIENTNAGAKAGLMIRESTAANAPYIFVYVTPSNGISVTWRSTAGGVTSTAYASASGTAPKYLRVVRSNNSFATHRSDNGSFWNEVGGTSKTINMSSTATIGMAVTSLSDGTLCTATMTSVTATP